MPAPQTSFNAVFPDLFEVPAYTQAHRYYYDLIIFLVNKVWLSHSTPFPIFMVYVWETSMILFSYVLESLFLRVRTQLRYPHPISERLDSIPSSGHPDPGKQQVTAPTWETWIGFSVFGFCPSPAPAIASILGVKQMDGRSLSVSQISKKSEKTIWGSICHSKTFQFSKFHSFVLCFSRVTLELL